MHRAASPKPEALKVVETLIPKPSANEVLIRVETAGVNRPDVLQRMGLYPPPPGHSSVPGLEVAGTVVAAGSSVELDRRGGVAALGAPVLALCNGGGYAEYVSVPSTQCLPVPASLDPTQAGCVAETFFTVWHNMFQQTNAFGDRVGAGDAVLVHGGSSGIGTTAIQMGAALGLRVLATAGSAEKCAACVEMGAVAAFDYKVDDFVERVAEATGGNGVQLVLDMVAGDYTQRNLDCLAVGGRIAVIASLGGLKSTISMRDVMRKRLMIGGSTLRARDDAAKGSIAAELRDTVWPLIESGDISVRVDKVFDLEDAPAAHAYMESSKHIGKIALRDSKSQSS